MMTDRTTKALLLAIAIGLWLNLLGGWIRPAVVQAEGNLFTIEMAVTHIADGTCANRKVC
jgi:hypothetical protein